VQGEELQKANELLKEFKGNSYAYGKDALEQVGTFATTLGKDLVVITGQHSKKSGILAALIDAATMEGVKIREIFEGARPNAPREDVYRMAYQLACTKADGVISVGGGSCIDAAKAALVLKTYGGVIDDYFGVGKVTEKSNGEQLPLLAVQTASSSAAHLSKYSNITDPATAQKKLIVDESIVPPRAVFDYSVTREMSPDFTKDGGLDGISHLWEVWMGATGQPNYSKVSQIAYTGIKLIVDNLPTALEQGDNLAAREALGLGTDLGGYAIMIGGTNGGHLGSFSLVDLLSHGRACAILNPYYTMLFAPAIQDQIRQIAPIFKAAGFISQVIENLEDNQLAEAVTEAMLEFLRHIDFPTTLREVGATEATIEKMIKAAKDPALKMKLQSMPTPMDVDAGDVDRVMKPTLKAAFIGNLSLIPSME